MSVINIKNYIDNKKWREKDNEKRCFELFNLLRGYNNKNLLEKMGIVLIYNQLNEDLIKDIIIMSYVYFTLKLQPKEIDININFDRYTYGMLINKFKESVIKEVNYDVLIEELIETNKKRNIIVHKMLKINNNKETENLIDDYLADAEECFKLLLDYYDSIFWDISKDIDM